MSKKNIFAVCTALMLVTTAFPAVAQTFSGPRVEARIGIDGGGITLQDTRDFNGRGTFGGRRNAADVALVGEVGFDVQNGRLVFGGYGTIERSQLEQNYPTQGVNFETGRNLTVGARAGLVISENVLAYGKVGYSNGRLNPTFATAAAQTPYANYSKDRDGVHFGGGVEIPVVPTFYVKFDYTHTLYKDFQVNANQELRFDRKQLTAGIGYRF